jgi:hypothetical protein
VSIVQYDIELTSKNEPFAGNREVLDVSRASTTGNVTFALAGRLLYTDEVLLT